MPEQKPSKIGLDERGTTYFFGHINPFTWLQEKFPGMSVTPTNERRERYWIAKDTPGARIIAVYEMIPSERPDGT